MRREVVLLIPFLVRLLLLWQGCQGWLGRRIEISTPVNQWMRGNACFQGVWIHWAGNGAMVEWKGGRCLLVWRSHAPSAEKSEASGDTTTLHQF